jgi:hypothetical protein
MANADKTGIIGYSMGGYDSAATSENLIDSSNHAALGIRPASIPRLLLLKKIRNDRKHIKRNRQKARRIIVVRRRR